MITGMYAEEGYVYHYLQIFYDQKIWRTVINNCQTLFIIQI